MTEKIYDYVIIGSGFGGSVSAMRLTEKGYSVLVLEKGKRFKDSDFATSNWQFWKYLWMPALRAFGILQISITKGAMVLHGAGVGGGSRAMLTCSKCPAMKPSPLRPGTSRSPGGTCCIRISRRPRKCWAWPAIPNYGKRTSHAPAGRRAWTGSHLPCH